MFDSVSAIAQQVESRWAAADLAEDSFPRIAAQALSEHLPPTFEEIAEALSSGLVLPDQRRLDLSFGQPALTLHRGERFVVEALCWHTGSPGIHQHSFCGAFRVMTGRSVHSVYRFTPRKLLAGNVTVGNLVMANTRVLSRDDVIAIPAGEALIHSAFHLDTPSMTLIVRTYDAADPEYTYLPPGVAYDPSRRSETLHKRMQLLDTLNLVGHKSYLRCVEQNLDTSDLYEGMEVLLRIQMHTAAQSALDELADRYVKLHGPDVEPIVHAARELRRRSQLLSLRVTVHDPDVRYVLACLLTTSDRDSFTRQLAILHHHSDAAVALGKCLRSVLGFDDGTDALLTSAAESMLTGQPVQHFVARVEAELGETLEAESSELLLMVYQQLLEHPLLAPLRTSVELMSADETVIDAGGFRTEQ